LEPQKARSLLQLKQRQLEMETPRVMGTQRHWQQLRSQALTQQEPQRRLEREQATLPVAAAGRSMQQLLQQEQQEQGQEPAEQQTQGLG
jgi:hypothetical protein